jgi:hypothetical protein
VPPAAVMQLLEDSNDVDCRAFVIFREYVLPVIMADMGLGGIRLIPQAVVS